jgi:hypothetical protein
LRSIDAVTEAHNGSWINIIKIIDLITEQKIRDKVSNVLLMIVSTTVALHRLAKSDFHPDQLPVFGIDI